MRGAARCRGGATGIFSRRIEQRRWFSFWEPDLLRAQADAQHSVQSRMSTRAKRYRISAHDRAPGFDLLAEFPKRGDRNLCDREPALFLEGAPSAARG